MPWPTIAKCFEEIAEDPTLLHLFSLEEYSSLQELPCLGAVQCRLVWEGIFAHIASPNNWGKAGMRFITLTSLKMSRETTLYDDPHHQLGGREGLGFGDGILSP